MAKARPPATTSATDALWSAYRNTVFCVSARLDLKRDFAIVTADNPGGVLRATSANRAAEAALRAELTARTSEAPRVVGCAPDFSFCENGFAAFLARDEALALAKRFDQRAIYLVANGDLHLLPCNPADPPAERLGLFAARVVRKLQDDEQKAQGQAAQAGAQTTGQAPKGETRGRPSGKHARAQERPQ